ncbi:cbb3-type cytochrome c oxidase subunit 3 [Paracoccus sp. p4-l81]|uniref:cbb3-type cytochrome c oxidase subunit 3 n=1 Tax=unclassified Paracoccus (in: a-proteobacteria) TaxID=2688777 RepID=UPI0035B8DFA9
MDLYTLLRQFADSWALLVLFLFFIGVLFWAFRPGSRRVHQDIAESIFRHEKKPAETGGERTPDRAETARHEEAR